jgi:predicted homoserine dehydrogenase-like protein
VCNATGLTPAPQGLLFPPASVDDIPNVMRPIAEGGHLHHKGQVEVISSLEADGRVIPYDIRFGVFVVFEGETEYIRNCFKEYMVRTDASGRYACLYKRWHLIGLEVGISVASKRNLKAGEVLDGEGGYTVVGKLMPANTSITIGALSLGLAHGVKMLRPVMAGQPVRWTDVAVDESSYAVQLRREMEQQFAPAAEPAIAAR